MSKKRSFAESVHEVVRRIPPGQTMSYGDVAKRAGYLGAARAVGTLLSKNFDPSIPCHRVIRADGKPGRYNRGDDMKAALLAREKREDCKKRATSRVNRAIVGGREGPRARG